MPASDRIRSAAAAVAVVLLAGVVVAECLPLSDLQGGDGRAPGTRSASSGSGMTVLSYAVDLTVDETTSFETKSVILIEATEAKSVIIVNAKRLDVDLAATVQGKSSGVRIPVDKVVVHEDSDEVELQLRDTLTQGDKYEVTVSATGQFGAPSDDGFVRATFDRQKSWMAVIRESPTSARMVFPCVDVPDVAVDVTLRVTRPTTHTVISNGNVIKTEAIGSLVAKDTFATVTLAPHQVGVVVAPLGKRPAQDDSAVTLWARAEAVLALDAVREYVTTLSDVVENLSGLPLGLEHLAVVALPGVSDATANAGIVALSEEAVVALHPASPPSAQRDALLSLSEAVGQPSVRASSRPLLWADAWVPRGLAAHLRQTFADQAMTGWRLAEQQMALQLQDVLENGAKTTDSALTSATDIGQSSASADKGAVLVRMLEYALNGKVFDEAVRRYYQLASQQPLTVDDMYDAFSSAVYDGDAGLPDGVTVVNIMTSWTSKPGYPVLTVVRDYESSTAMTVSQKKFTWAQSSAAEAEAEGGGAEVEWWLPLAYTSSNVDGPPPTGVPSDWLVPGENDMELEMAHLSDSDWVYFNVDQAAPYRVNYDTFNWRMLTQELRGVEFDKNLAPTSRAHLLGDAMALARAGEMDYALALDLLVYLRREGDLVPWLVARRSLAFLEARLDGDDLDALRQLEALLLKDVYLDGQFDMGGSSQPDVALLREMATSWACDAGLDKCIDHVDELYRLWRGGGDPPTSVFMEAVLCRAVAKHGDDALTFVLAGLSGDSLVGGQRRSYVRALACASSADLIQRAVEEALRETGPFMASEIGELLVAASSRKPTGWTVVTDLLQNKYQQIVARTGNAAGLLESLSLQLASQVSSQVELDQLLQAVLAAEGEGGARASLLADAIQKEVAVNLAWSDHYGELVADWIRVYLGLPEPTPAATTAATGSTSPAKPTSPTTPNAPTTTPTAPNTTPSAPTAPVPSGSSVLQPALLTVLLLTIGSFAPRF